MKKFALCIHDLKLSEGEEIEKIIDFISTEFEVKNLTLHLIVDTDIKENTNTIGYLIRKIKSKELEVVFHGAKHVCIDKPWKALSWFHKYEAEFLSKYFNKEINSSRFEALQHLVSSSIGICPPCWLASSNGWRFIQELHPLYIEKLFSISSNNKTYFSPVLSMGSNNEIEVKMLSILLSAIRNTSITFGYKKIRVVVHKKDLTSINSINMLIRTVKILKSKGYHESLQYDLIRQ